MGARSSPLLHYVGYFCLIRIGIIGVMFLTGVTNGVLQSHENN